MCQHKKCPYRSPAPTVSSPQRQNAPKKLHHTRCAGHNEPMEILDFGTESFQASKIFLRCARPAVTRCNSTQVLDRYPLVQRDSHQGAGSGTKLRCNHGDIVNVITHQPTAQRDGKRYAQCPRRGESRCSFFKVIEIIPKGGARSSTIIIPSSRASPSTSAPKCKCGFIAMLKRDKTNQPNSFKYYYTCPKQRPHQCSFFQLKGDNVQNRLSEQSNTPTRNIHGPHSARLNFGGNTAGIIPNGTTEASPEPIAPICACGKVSKELVVTQNTPNRGKQFFICANEHNRCAFFKWGKDHALNVQSRQEEFGRASNEALSVPGNNVANRNATGDLFEDDEEETMECHCAQEAVRRTVKKLGPNTGKDFFACKNPPKQQCGFFAWAKKPVSASGRPSTAGSKASSGRAEPGGDGSRPSSRSAIHLVMDQIDSLSFKLHFTTQPETKDAAKRYRHAKITKTDVADVERVSIPLDKLSDFENYLSALAGTRVVCDVPDTTRVRIKQFFKDEKRREEGGDIVTRPLNEILPEIVCEKLMEFQWHGVHFALKRGGRCLIGDDMGLGKTLQAIAVARIYMSDWPLLIVCPSSLRLNWKEEILQWLGEDVKEEDIHVLMTGKDADTPVNLVNIVSYDLFRKIPSHTLSRCGFVIADESHYLKNGQAKRSKAVLPVIKNAKRALLLSGTPALSRPVELFPQVNAILPKLFPNYMEYVHRYCNAHQGAFGLDVRGASNLSELNALLRGSVLIRRKKEEVLTQLPDKQRQVIWVETDPKVMKEVRSAQADLQTAQEALQEAAPGINMIRLKNAVQTAQIQLWSATGLAKLKSILEFCKDTAAGDCKFIVFAHHAEIIQGLCDFFTNKLKIGIIKIDGHTAQKHRQGLCKKFQTDPECRIAVLSITAAGVGLTLTKATVVLFAELYWNPGSLLQAEDRAHRIGQKDCVFVKYLLGRGTIDQSMWNTVRKKLSVVGHSLTGAAARMDVVDEPGGIPAPADGGIERFFQKKKDVDKEKNDTQATVDATADPIESIDDDPQPGPSASISNEPPGLESDDDSVIEVPFPTTLSQVEPRRTGTSQHSQKRHRARSAASTPDSSKRFRNIFPEVIDLDPEPDDILKQVQIDRDMLLARQLQEQFDRELT